ncbi:MAG TPA: DNA primase [Wenzhouxiangella sp.]|nr:DNA primase [Wenzhouxiangella sp.]
MAGLIPEDFIETLLDRVDIVEIIGSRVDLKPAGRGEFKALCPFHDEKTASFTVSADKQFYHCFGCGAHGSAIGFVMNHDGLEFPAAVEELAQLVGLEVPRQGGRAPTRKHDRLYQALTLAQDWFVEQLDAGSAAREYLKRRGFDAATITEFGIGFAPQGWQLLADRLTASGFSAAELEQAGLVSLRDGRVTDRFRNRIMFPIHDRRGRVIAFGGRALGERGPKYINTSETPVFHKGRELYRLYQVRRGGLPDQILVVEGYMDAAALHQYGVENAVATLGTSVTPEHVDLMFRAAPVVVFCFDGDRAGRQAAWRGLEVALPRLGANREVRFLFMPEGEDPDSLVRRHGERAFRQRVAEAVPLSEFFFDRLAESVDMETIDGRARLVALAEPHLNKLPDAAFAALMRQELRRRTGYSSHNPAPASRAQASPVRLDDDRALTPVQYAVALIVQQPGLADGVQISMLEGPAQVRGLEFLRELIEFCRDKPHFTTAKLLEAWRGRREQPWLARLAARPVSTDQDSMSDMLTQTLGRIRRQIIETRIRELQQIQLNQGGLDEASTRELRKLLNQRTES